MAPGCNLLYLYAMSSPAAVLFQAHLGSSQQLPFRALGRTQKQNGSKQTSFLCVTASLLAKPISEGTKSEQHTFKVLSGASYLWTVIKKKRACSAACTTTWQKGLTQRCEEKHTKITLGNWPVHPLSQPKLQDTSTHCAYSTQGSRKESLEPNTALMS